MLRRMARPAPAPRRSPWLPCAGLSAEPSASPRPRGAWKAPADTRHFTKYHYKRGLYINTAVSAPPHGKGMASVSGHIAHGRAEPARHLCQGCREQGRLGRHKPAHSEVRNHRVRHRHGKDSAGCAGAVPGGGGRRRSHGRVHRGRRAGCQRAHCAPQGVDGHLPDGEGSQGRGRPVQDDRPAVVDRRRGRHGGP